MKRDIAAIDQQIGAWVAKCRSQAEGDTNVRAGLTAQEFEAFESGKMPETKNALARMALESLLTEKEFNDLFNSIGRGKTPLDEIDKEVGEWLSRKRLSDPKHGISVEAAAEYADLSKQELEDYESGKKPMTVRALAKFATRWKISPSELSEFIVALDNEGLF